MSTTLPTSTSSSTSASASSAYFKCRWVGCTYGVFPSELEVYHHVKRIHRNEGSGGQECDWVGNMDQRCGLLLRHKHHFVDHLSSHFSPSLKPFTCEHCVNSFHRNRQALRKHLFEVHPELMEVKDGAPIKRKSTLRVSSASAALPPPVSSLSLSNQYHYHSPSEGGVDGSDNIKRRSTSSSHSSSASATSPQLVISPGSGSGSGPVNPIPFDYTHKEAASDASNNVTIGSSNNHNRWKSVLNNGSSSSSSAFDRRHTIHNYLSIQTQPPHPPPLIRSMRETASSPPTLPVSAPPAQSSSSGIPLPYALSASFPGYSKGQASSPLSPTQRASHPPLFSLSHLNRYGSNGSSGADGGDQAGNNYKNRIISSPTITSHFPMSSSIASSADSSGAAAAASSSTTNPSLSSSTSLVRALHYNQSTAGSTGGSVGGGTRIESFDQFSFPLIKNPSSSANVGLNPRLFQSNVENLCFGTNTSIPPIWIDIAKNAADRNSFVSPIANVEFLNWIVHVNELSLESVLEIRRKSFLSNMRVMFKIQCEQTVVTINSIKQKLVEEYRYRRSELDKFISNNRNDPTTPMPTIASIRMYFPSYNNPLRELAFHLHRTNWSSFMTASNEDTAEFIELAPSSSHYLRPSDCRGAMIGLKVSIKHQFGKVPLGVRKSAILAYTTAFNELADEIVGREVWDGSNVCQSIIQQLCCSGHLCGGDGDGGSSQVSSSIMSNNMNGNTIPNPLTGAGSLSLLTSSVNSNGQSRTQQGRPVVRLNYIGLDAGEGVPIVIVWLKLGMDANWVINAAPPTVTDPHILCPSYNQFLNVS